METLFVFIMIILFFVLMAFIFSTALLTPLIGKKNFLFVVGLGFIVGLIGGAFFIAPVYDDLPDMVRGIYMSTSDEQEIITINISTDSDVNKAIEEVKQIPGVLSVKSGEITVKTTTISDDWKSSLESRMTTVNSNITSANIISNDTIMVQIKPGSDPTDVIKKLDDWMVLVSGVDIRFSIVEVQVVVDASQVDSVVEQLPQGEVVVTGISGPVENEIQTLKQSLPSNNNIILFCGLLGVIVGLVGMFIDSIIQGLKAIKDRLRKKE
ncbi:MAG: hypothetical protein A4E25_02338 [Methanobacterium sp. PtaB.Bin024]|nr:MAG: hypothetical protein A4E25_02338 [Methanobacterium sp. PtaB.Bin024]